MTTPKPSSPLPDGILSGIKVLDFGRYIAGPYCAALLADHGAEVIRIDKRGGSEDRFTAPVTDDGVGALYLQVNRNKRSLTLNPRHPEAGELMSRLIKQADVVVANLPARTLKAMKLDYDSLSAINPRIILVTASAYGDKGPWAERVGFDGVGQAMSGAIHMTGEPDQPYRASVNWVDYGTALHCAYSTVLALMARDKTGRGQVVTGTLLGTALTFTNSMLIEQAALNINRQPTGNRGQTAAPVDIYRTIDGWVLCQVVGQPLYERWAKLMGEDHWLTEARFATDEARGIHALEISERMQHWCDDKSTEQVLSILGEQHIPCGPVLQPQQTLDHPAAHALDLFQSMPTAGLDKAMPIARSPARLSETDVIAMKPAPALGADTDAILTELDFSLEQISEMRAAGIV